MSCLLIIDSSVLIELIELNLLHLLAFYLDLKDAVLVVPSKVYNEVLSGNRSSILSKQLPTRLRIISSSLEGLKRLRRRHLQLGDGELEVIALAIELGKAKNMEIIALIDEKKARRIVADVYRIEVHGTLWLIVEFKRKRLIDGETALNILKKILIHGFYLSENLLSKAVEIFEKDC
ncbi:MAG: hypothetical protein DRP00_04625 [Candidatus Aenigmatarchaeota archaeon]|nr:MAG: hypothetical protein DRP00_04625 [Candidatus Aenigmarchaeota archaeon]